MRQIDRGSRVPPWQQIANHLRAEIIAGEYDPEGPPLPSVRRLTEEWGVARRTANRALKELADEQLIEVVDGLGYFARRKLGGFAPSRMSWERHPGYGTLSTCRVNGSSTCASPLATLA